MVNVAISDCPPDERMRTKIAAGLPIQREIDELASMFSSLHYEQFSLSELTLMMNSKCLKLRDENELFDIICSLGVNYSQLFIYVQPFYLSASRKEQLVNSLKLVDIPAPILKEMLNQPARMKGEFPFSQSKPFDGIFARFAPVVSYSSKGGGDVEDLFREENDFYTLNKAGSWLIFNIGTIKVIPSMYSLQTYYRPPGFAHLQNWAFEGSTDGIDFVELDQQTDNFDLNGSFLIASFPVKKTGKAFNIFRLRMTGFNHRKNYILDLQRIEIFGTVC